MPIHVSPNNSALTLKRDTCTIKLTSKAENQLRNIAIKQNRSYALSNEECLNNLLQHS